MELWQDPFQSTRQAEALKRYIIPGSNSMEDDLFPLSNSTGILEITASTLSFSTRPEQFWIQSLLSPHPRPLNFSGSIGLGTNVLLVINLCLQEFQLSLGKRL